ncbi:MAG: hypothetical protein AAF617_17325 [Bacteroidota bacterium]
MMKKHYAFLFVLLLCISCKQNKESSNTEETKTPETEATADNPELIDIYKNDQNDRKTDDIDWYVVSKNDSLRRVRVHQLLDSNKVKTSKDYARAAMVFQHGGDSTAYGMAVKLMEKSIALDSTADKWLLAAATDRYLRSKGLPQIYGTQYFKMNGEPWTMGEIDTTKVTDEERIEFGVETLAQQRETLRKMNEEEGF